MSDPTSPGIEPNILAAAQAIRPLMPSSAKNTPWDKLDDAAQDRLKQIAAVCCAAAYPAQDSDPAP